MAKKGALTGLPPVWNILVPGNLIFPPSLGALSGEHFSSCYRRFCLFRRRYRRLDSDFER